MAPQILDARTWTRKERWKKGKRKRKGKGRERESGRGKERERGRRKGMKHNDDDDEGRINFSVVLSPKTTRTRNNEPKQ